MRRRKSWENVTSIWAPISVSKLWYRLRTSSAREPSSISLAAVLSPRAIVSIPTIWAMNRSSTSVLSLRLKYRLVKKSQQGKRDISTKKIIKDSQFGIKVESTRCNSILEKDKNNPVRWDCVSKVRRSVALQNTG